VGSKRRLRVPSEESVTFDMSKYRAGLARRRQAL
jgi:hypothetical protein